MYNKKPINLLCLLTTFHFCFSFNLFYLYFFNCFFLHKDNYLFENDMLNDAIFYHVEFWIFLINYVPIHKHYSYILKINYFVFFYYTHFWMWYFFVLKLKNITNIDFFIVLGIRYKNSWHYKLSLFSKNSYDSFSHSKNTLSFIALSNFWNYIYLTFNKLCIISISIGIPQLRYSNSFNSNTLTAY